MSKRKIKEPVRKPWIWIVMAVIVIAGVPFWYSEDAIEPFIFGFPYWAFISLVFMLLLCVYLCWLSLTQWNLIEEEEDGRKGDE
ncbi:hypothetical protein [Bacillus fonticola]|uniref:hypothetical protein n=1 Tax=Bacillus fonticola TaxID=2728853 RepID=UPI0014727498|nr:hypothetical protein [Bacillus fonticola]